MISTKVIYQGRVVAVCPPVLGPVLEALATIDRLEPVAPGPENGWQRGTRHTQRSLWWYTDDNEAFCTLSGLGPAIEQRLRTAGVEVTVEDRTEYRIGKPNLQLLAGVQWRPRQAEVLANVFGRRCGTIVCPMAMGKTFMIKHIARAYDDTRIVITAPSIDICNGIYADLVTDIPDLGRLGGGHRDIQRVTVAVSQSLQHCYPTTGLILADECHSLATDRYVELFAMFKYAKLFGFTASPEGRSDKSDGLIEALFGPRLVEIGYQEAVTQGSVVQLKVEVYPSGGPRLPSGADKITTDRRGLWQNVERNELIARVARSKTERLGADAQILIMVDKTEHAYRLGQLLPEFTIVTGAVDQAKAERLRDLGALKPGQQLCDPKARNAYRKAFERNELKHVICTKVWRQGVDFRDLACLIRADGLASRIDSLQVPGRLSRLGLTTDKSSGLLVDFLDEFTPRLKANARARLAQYEDNGWEIIHAQPPEPGPDH